MHEINFDYEYVYKNFYLGASGFQIISSHNLGADLNGYSYNFFLKKKKGIF